MDKATIKGMLFDAQEELIICKQSKRKERKGACEQFKTRIRRLKELLTHSE